MCKQSTISTGYIYPKNQKMAVLNDCNYKNLARILTDLIGGDEFFNGSAVLDTGDVRLTLKATLLVYRESGKSMRVVPVWYECEVTEGGCTVANEFSWSEFQPFLELAMA